MERQNRFAELLAKHMASMGWGMDRLAEASGIPKQTLVGWHSKGRRPRLWQDLLKVAAALGLNAVQADELLAAAGHPSLERLRRSVLDEKARAVLAPWASVDNQLHVDPIVLETTKSDAEANQDLLSLTTTNAPRLNKNQFPGLDVEYWRKPLFLVFAAAAVGLVMVAIAIKSQAPIVVPQPTTSVIAENSIVAATPTDEVNVCGEAKRTVAPDVSRFVRSQGVSTFTVDNTKGAVSNNKVRAVAIDSRGLWIGYFATEENTARGLGHYNKKDWAQCGLPEAIGGSNINALATDQTGNVWVATEDAGVAMFDGTVWQRFKGNTILPSNQTFGITIDKNNNVWIATLEGVAKYDVTLQQWSVPYTGENGTLFYNNVHAIAFDGMGNTWVGHISKGVSQYSNAEHRWLHHTAKKGSLGGDNVRGIVVRNPDDAAPESVWFATEDGGVTKFEQGKWTAYMVEDGLPSNDVKAVAIDPYNRVWAATAGGVAYFSGTEWIVYNTINTYSLAFGADCKDCPFEDNDHVWTGTATMGLTHSRLPYPDAAVDVTEVCFETIEKERTCQQSFVQGKLNGTPILAATYTRVLTPGTVFRPEIVVVPRAPYQLREDRGDFLSNTDVSDEQLFGAHVQVAVKGAIDVGQPFRFVDYNKPLIAPQLLDGEQERTFTSTWRVWMKTRYVGPYIRLVFTVRRG